MIFASDLDRTLIYSNKFLKEDGDYTPVIIEYYKGEPISWVTTRALEQLKALARKITFVPITTRSREQYNRIMLWQWVPHRYAVTTNGANIMIDGEPDIQWNQKVHQKIEAHCEHPQKVSEILRRHQDCPWMVKIREVEAVFHYYVVDEKTFEKEPVEILKQELGQVGWNTLYNGRKIYFIPEVLEKGNALEYIVEREGAEQVYAAGDTVLDLSMAAVANLFFVPGHGDVSVMQGGTVKILEARGITAAETICEMVMNTLK